MKTSSPLILSNTDYNKLAALIRNVNTDAAELLEEEISRASVVPVDRLPENVVTMNSTVSFEDVETGKESTVTLVYPHEASIEEGRISILAPVGIALIGLRVGQSIRWPLPNGKERELKVIAVSSGPRLA